MSDSAIITFNADREKLANNLGKALKTSNKAIPGITSDFSTTYASGFQLSFKLFDSVKVSFSPHIGNNFTCVTVIGIN